MEISKATEVIYNFYKFYADYVNYSDLQLDCSLIKNACIFPNSFEIFSN